MFQKIIDWIRFWKYNTHPAKMESRARGVVLLGVDKAFKFFKDPEFRRLISFEKQSEEEQNRFFNELVVTNLVLLMLLLDQSAQEENDSDKKEYLRVLRASVPEYYKQFIRRIGIQENLASIWDKLLDLRYDEYTSDTLEVRRQFFSSGEKELNEYGLDNRLMFFQTIALGLYRHLMRGKIKKGDPLYLHIQKYLVPVQKSYIRKIG